MLQENEIKMRLKKICICKSISQGKIIDAIKNGLTTVNEINQKLHTGTGDCKGTRCQSLIKEILTKELNDISKLSN